MPQAPRGPETSGGQPADPSIQIAELNTRVASLEQQLEETNISYRDVVSRLNTRLADEEAETDRLRDLLLANNINPDTDTATQPQSHGPNPTQTQTPSQRQAPPRNPRSDRPNSPNDPGERRTGGRARRALILGAIAVAAVAGGAALAIGLSSGGGKKVGTTTTEVATPNRANPSKNPLQAETATTAPRNHNARTTSPNNSPTASAITKAESARTASGVVEALANPSSDQQTKTEVYGILTNAINNPNKHYSLDHTSTQGAMSSDHAERQAGIHMGPRNEALHFAASLTDPAYLATQYNIAHGGSARAELPSGVSHAQALEYFRTQMTGSGNRFGLERPTGKMVQTFGQNGENVFPAQTQTYELDGTKAVFVIHLTNGHDLYIKMFQGDGGIGCFNALVEQAVAQAPAPAPTPRTITFPHPTRPGVHVTITIPHTPPQHNQSKPPVTIIKKTTTTPVHHPKPVKHHPTKPTQPEQPTQPTQPTQPPTKPNQPPNKPPKTDTNTTPAGTGGNHGTGTNSPTTEPGVGPAGQQPGSDGFVPGEHHPNTPPPASTPAPVTQPGPSPEAGSGETGTDNGPTQPSTGTGDTGTTVTPPAPGTTFNPPN